MSVHPTHYLTFQTTCYISEQSIYWSFCLLEAIESFYVIHVLVFLSLSVEAAFVIQREVCGPGKECYILEVLTES